MATEAEWRAAYEGKIDDLRRETLRTSALSALAVRLYQALSSEWTRYEDRGNKTARRFWADGVPAEERDALVAALRGRGMDLDVDFVDGSACPYPEGECTCGNGIGCVNVPVGEW